MLRTNFFLPWCQRPWWSRIAGGCLWPDRLHRSISCSSRCSYLLCTPGPLLKTMSEERQKERVTLIYWSHVNVSHRGLKPQLLLQEDHSSLNILWTPWSVQFQFVYWSLPPQGHVPKPKLRHYVKFVIFKDATNGKVAPGGRMRVNISNLTVHVQEYILTKSTWREQILLLLCQIICQLFSFSQCLLMMLLWCYFLN